MAEDQRREIEYSIANWNAGGKGTATNRRKVYIHHLRQLEELPDLVFLQEVTFKIKRVARNTRYDEKTSDIFREAGKEMPYLGVCDKDSSGRYTAILYKRDKFEDCTMDYIDHCRTAYIRTDESDIMRDARHSNERIPQSSSDFLQKHFAMAILKVKDHPNTKIITVSFHNCAHKYDPQTMLNVFITWLRNLKQQTGFTVLLAGDFNMDASVFGEYPPTEHRWDQRLIDNICLHERNDAAPFELRNVQAHMIDIPEDYDHDTVNQQSRQTITRRFRNCNPPKSEQYMKKMIAREDVSNHDPLTAKLVMRIEDIADSESTETEGTHSTDDTDSEWYIEEIGDDEYSNGSDDEYSNGSDDEDSNGRDGNTSLEPGDELNHDVENLTVT